jgi:hypothetical protein
MIYSLDRVLYQKTKKERHFLLQLFLQTNFGDLNDMGLIISWKNHLNHFGLITIIKIVGIKI